MKPFAMIAAVVALGFAAWHYAAPEPQALVHLMYQTQTFPQMAVKANAVLAGQGVGIGGGPCRQCQHSRLRPRRQDVGHFLW